MAIARRVTDLIMGPDRWAVDERGPRQMARRFLLNRARDVTVFTFTTPFLGFYDELFTDWDWNNNQWFQQLYRVLRKGMDSLTNPFKQAPSLLPRSGFYDNKQVEGRLCVWGDDPYCHSWSQGGHLQAMGPVERFLRNALGDGRRPGWLIRDRDLGFRRADWAFANFMNTLTNTYAAESYALSNRAGNIATAAAVASNPAGYLIARNRAYANFFTVQQLLTVPANIFGGLMRELGPITRCLYFGGRNRDYRRRPSCYAAFPAAYRIARRPNQLGWLWSSGLERQRAGGTESWTMEDTD